MSSNVPVLTPEQARQIVLHSQQLPPAKAQGSALEATLQAIEQLGYIQIDTISVVARAHHHTLWNRNPRYQPAQLDQLLEQKQVFEYWSHAAAYLPMRDYRFSLWRKRAIASGEQDHWYERDHTQMRYVLERIRTDGPLMAKDFEDNGKPTSEWHRKPAKRALEYLFMQGELMVPRRQSFQKVYDLTERVLPAGVDDHPPSAADYTRYLILDYLRAHGLAQAKDFGHLLKHVKASIGQELTVLLQDGVIQEVKVGATRWYALADALSLLDKPLSRRLKILSPFDNLLIQRERMRQLFDFDYQIECYVPEPKRKFGYFSLPILWDGRLVARMDCKAERKVKVMRVHHLALEPGLGQQDAFHEALMVEMEAFLVFNGCERVEGIKV